MMKNRLLIAAAAAALLGGNGRLMAQPQTPDTTPPPAPRHGILGRRHTRPTVGSLAPITGGIIGNKRTHVYHLPGDTGNLPATKNRVYFRSEAEARAAGFHAAGRAGRRSVVNTSHRRLPGLRRTRTVPPSVHQPSTTPTTPAPNQ